MTTHFMRRGDTVRITDARNLPINDRLEGGTYQLQFDPDSGFFLSQKVDLKTPSKCYGNTRSLVDRICTTFVATQKNTGVMLTGEKGSGKTMTARAISKKMLEDHDVPTIVINSQFAGDSFLSFLNAITQPCVVLFDEFEKVYHDDGPRTQILGLFDGLVHSNKLFIVTTNDMSRVSEFMINRPGRLRYRVEFEGVEREAIIEYCEDNLNNLAHTASVLQVSDLVYNFNFDMLVHIVDEMNRYHESAFQSAQFLNIRPAYGAGMQYDVAIRSKTGDRQAIFDSTHGLNPVFSEDERVHLNVEFYSIPVGSSPPDGFNVIDKYNVEKLETHTHHDEYLHRQHITHSDLKTGVTTFELGDFIYTVTQRRQKKNLLNIFAQLAAAES